MLFKLITWPIRFVLGFLLGILLAPFKALLLPFKIVLWILKLLLFAGIVGVIVVIVLFATDKL